MHRRIPASIAAALTISLIAASETMVGQPAANALSPQTPALAESNAIAGPTAVSGRVTVKGRPAAGALVTLRVWPTPEHLAQIPIGGVVPVAVVANAVTDATGDYELKVADPRLIADYRDSRGAINAEVVVASRMSTGTAVAKTLASNTDTEASAQSGTSGARVNISATDAATPAQLLQTGSLFPNANGGPTSIWFKVASLGLRTVQIEHVATTVAGASAKVTNAAASYSELGIGASVTSASAGFTLSGTSSVKAETSASYPKQSQSGSKATSVKYYREVEYDLYQEFWVMTGSKKAMPHWEARPTGYVGGGWTVGKFTVPTVAKSNCTNLGHGVTMTLNSTAATTFSGGVSLSKIIGINLSSKSGRSATQKVVISNTSSKVNMQVCGVTGLPGKANSGALVIRKKP